jgi:CHASE1-domain containing sensor protein
VPHLRLRSLTRSGVGKLNASLKALQSGFTRLGGHLRRGAPAYTVLFVALVLSLLASYYVQHNIEAQAQSRFDEITQATQQAIDRRTKAYLDVMFGARALFYASENVTKEEWSNYVEAIDPATHFKGLQALSYAQHLSASQRDAFIQKAKQEGLPPIRPELNSKAAAAEEERSSYFPITYTGPIDQANQSMLGYDLYAEGEHREAMDKARDTAEPQATKMVYVMSEAPPTSSAELALREGFVVY